MTCTTAFLVEYEQDQSDYRTLRVDNAYKDDLL